MQVARSCSAATTLTDSLSRIVVLGGQNTGSPLASVEAYNPFRDEWTALPAMSEGGALIG